MPKITFIERDGNRREVEAPVGLSILEIAHRNSIDIEGACEGSLACSTCHVIVAAEDFERLPEAAEEEEDMLDLAWGLTKTSRLGCQIIITEELDGLTVALPDRSRSKVFGPPPTTTASCPAPRVLRCLTAPRPFPARGRAMAAGRGRPRRGR